MALSKSTRQVSTHASTRKGGARAVRVPDGEALVRFAETLKLRSLARATQEDGARQRGDGHAAGVARSEAEGG